MTEARWFPRQRGDPTVKAVIFHRVFGESEQERWLQPGLHIPLAVSYDPLVDPLLPSWWPIILLSH